MPCNCGQRRELAMRAFQQARAGDLRGAKSTMQQVYETIQEDVAKVLSRDEGEAK
jgi:hypothetical protein